MASGSWSPTDVQLTRMSAASGASTARAPSSAASARARSGVRFQTPRRAAPALAQRPHRGAGRAAGAEHERAAAGRARSARAASSPGASVLSARIAPSSNVSVFAAPIARAASVASSASASAASLCGIVTLTPRKPAAGQRPHGLGEQVRRQRQAQVAPVVQPGGRQRGVVHRRRARVRDRPAADAEVASTAARARPGSARRRAANWASVDENACSPDLPGLRT